MQGDETQRPPMSAKARLLFALLFVGVLFILSLVIESCDTEKVQICDTTTGECDFESACRPLLLDIVRGIF